MDIHNVMCKEIKRCQTCFHYDVDESEDMNIAIQAFCDVFAESPSNSNLGQDDAEDMACDFFIKLLERHARCFHLQRIIELENEIREWLARPKGEDGLLFSEDMASVRLVLYRKCIYKFNVKAEITDDGIIVYAW